MTKSSLSIAFEPVEDMPEMLSQGVLYVSDEYEIACHLCACGCGSKVFTPLGPAEWAVTVRSGKPSLWPSIGSWALPCRSHYWITNGQIHWSTSWSDEQVESGRRFESAQRERHYGSSTRLTWRSRLQALWEWLLNGTK